MFLSKLASQLLEDFGIQFFAKPRRNMKNKLMLLHDKLLSRKRSIIETNRPPARIMKHVPVRNSAVLQSGLSVSQTVFSDCGSVPKRGEKS